MSEQELYTLLSSIKLTESPVTYINVSYDHFVDSVEPPFLVYRNNDTYTLKADDKVYFEIKHYEVDLVTDTKNTELEKKVEKVFNDNDIPYEKVEQYIGYERIYQITYNI